MGQVLHRSATTTEAIRRAIQRSEESLRTLAKRYGINQKTVAKWKKRASVTDLPTGPKQPKSTVLSIEEEAIIVAFRRHTLLPLDDCLYALQPTIPHLTRSSLHRCLQRHGIGRLPEVDGEKPEKKRFKSYPIGFFHIDLAEVRTEEGKLYLYVAVDRTSKFAFVQLVERANTVTARAFLDALVAAVPYKIEIVLTDNGIQFADLPKNRSGPTAMFRGHPFDRACRSYGIEHRLTKPNHPWTNGQVERMNRTIKEATVRRYHYSRHDQLRRHLDDCCLRLCDRAERANAKLVEAASEVRFNRSVYRGNRCGDRFNGWPREVGPYRAKVLHLLAPEFLESDRYVPRDDLVGCLGQANSPWCSERLHPCGDIDGISENIAAAYDDLSDMEPDPEVDAAFLRNVFIYSGYPLLDVESRFQRVNRARELGQNAVACRVGNPAVVLRDQTGCYVSICRQQTKSRGFIRVHKARVPRRIRCKNGDELSLMLCVLSGHVAPPCSHESRIARQIPRPVTEIVVRHHHHRHGDAHPVLESADHSGPSRAGEEC